MLRLVGHPVAVNPDAELGRVARAEGWEVLRFERLGRRLRVAGAAGFAAGLGGLGSVVISRRSAPAARRVNVVPAAPPMSLRGAHAGAARDPRPGRALRRRADRARTPPAGTASTRSRASCSASSDGSG